MSCRQTTWQHPALSVTSLHEQEEQRRPSAKQASHQQPGRSKRTASPSHSLLLELEVSKSAADSGALLSVLSVGQQVSSASSFPTAMGESVPASSIASTEDLATNLQPRACQEDSAPEKVLGTFKDYSFQTQGQDLASRDCRDSNSQTQLPENNLVNPRQSAVISLQSVFGSSIISSFAWCLRCLTALLCTFSLVFETLRTESLCAISLCAFSVVIENFCHPTFRSFSQINRARTRWRRRPPTQLSSFLVFLLAAATALTVQGQTVTGSSATLSLALRSLPHDSNMFMITTFDSFDAKLPQAPAASFHKPKTILSDELVGNLVVHRDRL